MPVQAPPNPNVQTGTNPNVLPDPNDPAIKKIRIGLASLDNNVDAFAREAAHEELAEPEKGPLWQKFTGSVWKLMMREHILVKKTREKREEIIQNENLRHHKGEDGQEWYEGVSRRYASEYAEHLMREDETFHKLNDAEHEHDPDAVRIRTDINEFLAEYAKGIIDDASTEPYLDRMFEEWRNDNVGQQFIGEGQFLAHNMLDAAKQVKSAYEARQGLNALEQDEHLKRILENVAINVGEAKIGSETEIGETVSERLAEKLRNLNVPFINEERLAAVRAVLGNEVVVSAILSAALYVGQRGASSMLSMLAPGLGAGIVAGFRERRALRDERKLMERRRDNGETPDLGRKGQAELEETLHESRPVTELLNELAAFYDQNGDLTLRDRGDLDKAMQLQGEIRARLQISDREKISLINFADVSADEMEARRFDLMLAMAKLETDVKNLFSNPVALAMLGIQQGETFEALLQEQCDIITGALKGEMTAKDRLFNKLVLKRGLKRAVITGLSSIGVGAVLHYGYEAIDSLLSHWVGGVKSAADFVLTGNGTSTDVPGTTDTITGEAPDIPDTIGGSDAGSEYVSGGGHDAIPGHSAEAPSATIDHEASKGGETIKLSDRTKVILPEGYHATAHGSGVTITMPNGSVVETTLDKNGALGKDAMAILEKNGFKVLHHKDIVQGEPKVTHEKVTGRQFVENHKGSMVKITHQKWFDNNTQKYDLNELGLHNNKLGNGDIRISINNMTAGGSFHGKSGVDWHEAAKQGHLMLYLSESKGTQAHAFEIPVNSDGTVDLKENSPAWSLFNKDGKFIGGYQEVAIKGDVAPNGATKIATLATVVGERHGEITDTIVTPTTETAHTYVIVHTPETMSNSANAETNDGEDDFFNRFVPLVVRRDLGKSKRVPPKPRPAPAPNIPTNGGMSAGPSNPGASNNQQNTKMSGNFAGGPAGGQNTAPNNANQSDQQNNRPNTGPQQPPSPNNGRPTDDEWRKYANQRVDPNVKPGNNTNTAPHTPPNNPNTGRNFDPNDPNSWPTYQHATPKDYTPEETALIARLIKDKRDMPDTFKVLPWNPNMDARSRKIIVVVLHELIAASNRQSGETEGEWRIRVVEAGRAYAQQALGALNQVSPNIRSFTKEAMEAFLLVTQPTPVNSTGGAQSSNSSAASAAAP